MTLLRAFSLAALAAGLTFSGLALAQDYRETPSLEAAVSSGALPPVAERLPAVPRVTDVAAMGYEPGRPGGRIIWAAGRERDIRIMNVYGYARLVGYDTTFELQPDILEDFEVEDGRIFTFRLRPGHRWSDGEPFTTEDFRYWWEDIESNIELSPYGVDNRLVVEGELPTVEILDELTIRYSWSRPNPELLPAIAGATPLYLYAPSHYLRQFHVDYADPAELQAHMRAEQTDRWSVVHIRRGRMYDATNPALPTLEPWMNTTQPPSERYNWRRNPYFHRVDSQGYQLPYLDLVVVDIASPSLIAAKAGTGEVHLQARHLSLDDYTFLRQGAGQYDFGVRLWPTALGAEIALYPNLNAADRVWREVLRDARFRRALSMAIDRTEINEVLYFGLARPSNNYVLPQSPFYDEAQAALYTQFDIARANALLDEMGLTQRNARGVRLLPDGRPMELIVETAGERSSEMDALQLIGDNWARIGVALYPVTSQRDVFRTRVFAGETLMSVWFGWDNGMLTEETVPVELAPVNQNWLQYPAWGQYVQTGGGAGTPPDMDWGVRLMELYQQWRDTTDEAGRARIVREMLEIHVTQQTSIGIVQGVLQPVVVSNTLRNVPEEALYSWDPGAHFGVYRMDLFWVGP